MQLKIYTDRPSAKLEVIGKMMLEIIEKTNNTIYKELQEMMLIKSMRLLYWLEYWITKVEAKEVSRSLALIDLEYHINICAVLYAKEDIHNIKNAVLSLLR